MKRQHLQASGTRWGGGPGMGAAQRGKPSGRLRHLAFVLSNAALIAHVPTLLPHSACAQADAPGPDVIRLEQALERALEYNPDLAAFEFRLQEQVGRIQQVGLLPNPELKLLIENAAGSGIYSGYDSAETTLGLEWVLERGIRRRSIVAAEARSGLLLSDAELLRLDVAAETAQRFLSSLANQARLENADEAVSLAEDTVAAVGRRVRAGREPSAELTRAEAKLARTRLARDDVTHELASAYHRLAAQWGETQPGFSRVAGELLALPRTESFATLEKRIERNPQLARFVSAERLAQANLRLAEARRWPSLRPGLGVRRFEDTDDVALVAELRFTLPVFDRSQGQLAESRAALSRNRAEAEAERVRVHTALFEIYEELQHHLHRAQALREEVIPRLAKALEETRRGYEQGRYSYFEWGSVQAELLDAKSELVEASTGAHRLVIALERLTGERLTKP